MSYEAWQWAAGEPSADYWAPFAYDYYDDDYMKALSVKMTSTLATATAAVAMMAF